MLWHDVLGETRTNEECLRKTGALLDRGGTVKTTAALVECFRKYPSFGSKGHLPPLLEDCEGRYD